MVRRVGRREAWSACGACGRGPWGGEKHGGRHGGSWGDEKHGGHHGGHHSFAHVHGGTWGGEKHGAHVVHVAGDYLKNARRFHASVLTCSSYPTLHFMFRVLGLTFRFFFFFFVPSVGLMVIVMVMVIVVIVVMIIKDDNDDDEDENGDTMVTT
jgi:hypothetical protein